MIKRILLSLITSLCVVSTAFGQTAGLLFVSPQQFFNNNGTPLSGGKVYYYNPGTLTFKNVWSDANKATALTNPVVLNAAGRPNGAQAIYGEGSYRQIINDANGNQIADIVTASGGGGGGSGGSTGDGDLVGSIKPWAGLIAPNQYAFAYGQELSRNTYNALYTAITYSTIVTCTSGSATLTNVSDTTQISIGSKVELSCVAPGTTVISKTAITVTLSATSSFSNGATALFFPFGNGNGSTTFNIPDLRGYTIAGRDNMGGIAAARLTTAYFNPGGTSDPDALGAAGGNQSHTLLIGELAAHTHTGTTGGENQAHTHLFSGTTGTESANHTHTIPGTTAAQSGSGATGVGGSSTTGVENQAHTHTFSGNTGSETATHTHSFTTDSTGSDTAFSIVQPSLTLNYIIKILPDTASSISTGVTSISSMTGDITCGSGLLCTGNIISVTAGGGGVSSIGGLTGIISCGSGITCTAGTISATGGGAGSPSGPITSIQYNDSGSFNGSANLTWVDPLLSIGSSGTTGKLGILGTTSGTVTQTVQSVAGTPTITWGTSTGTPAVTASAPLAITAATGNIGITGAAGQILAGATPAFTSTPTLGASGTLGSITFGNATSGLLTLQTVTGALGSITLSLPAETDTLVGKATLDTFTHKTFDTAGAGNSLSIAGVAVTANSGTGSIVRATTPTLTTPILGVATATSINGLTISSSTGTLTIGNGKTFTVSNGLTLTGTDGTSFAFPSTSDTIVTLGASQTLTGKTLTNPSINGGSATALTGLGIRSSGSGAFDLTLNNTENLTAGRTLTLTVNNAPRTIDISGNITLASSFITSGSNSITLTSTGPTNVTLPTSGTLVNSTVSTLSNLASVGTITSGTWNANPIGLSFGGTGQTSASLSRTSSGLNIDQLTTFGNTNYNALTTDRTIATANSFTAPRTITLPAVSAFNSGQQLVIIDSVGAINGANTLTITAAGGDSINGLSSIIITSQYSGAVLWPVGSNKWGYIASSSGGGSGTVSNITAGGGLSTGTGSSSITTSGTLYSIVPPQGRLTLISGTPITNSNQINKSVIYYDCYHGNVVPYYNGTSDASDTIASCQVSLTMISAASAGQVVSGQVYDVWWIHGGANRICIAMSAATGGGGGWASDTAGSINARGTGYTQIHNTRGYWTNTNSITNCFNNSVNYGPVSADQGTYLGTIYATANGQTGMNFNPTAASGGTGNILGLYNAYHKSPVSAICLDSTASWNYNSTTYQHVNASTANSISYVDGLADMTSNARYNVFAVIAGYAYVAINRNAITIPAVQSGSLSGGGPLVTYNSFLPLAGFNTINALEASSTSALFYGAWDGTSNPQANGLFLSTVM